MKSTIHRFSTRRDFLKFAVNRVEKERRIEDLDEEKIKQVSASKVLQLSDERTVVDALCIHHVFIYLLWLNTIVVCAAAVCLYIGVHLERDRRLIQNKY